MEYAVSISKLVKKYAELIALNGVDLNIEKGDFFALLGPNGAGKSTLINILTSLCIKDEGNVEIFGYDVEKQYIAARLKGGVVPQELVSDSFFSVWEILNFQSGYYRIKHNQDWLEHLLELFDLKNYKHHPIEYLSGGLKKRFMIAKALVHKPELLILDEPTAGVDVELRYTLWQFLTDLNRSGTTILLTTHYIEEAEKLCNKVAIMKAGKIIAFDKTENLLHKLDQRTVFIKLVKRIEDLPAWIQKYGIEVEHAQNKLSLSLKFKQQTIAIPKLLKLILDSNWEIDDFSIDKPNLENLFLKLTHIGT